MNKFNIVEVVNRRFYHPRNIIAAFTEQMTRVIDLPGSEEPEGQDFDPSGDSDENVEFALPPEPFAIQASGSSGGAASCIETFSRNESDGWGTSEFGPEWTHSTANFDWAVDGDLGTVTKVAAPTPGSANVIFDEGLFSGAVEMRVKQTWSATTTFSSIELFGPIGTSVFAQFYFTPDGPDFEAFVDIFDDSGGNAFSQMTLTGDLADPQGKTFWWRVLMEETQISMKWWEDGAEEPAAYQLIASNGAMNFVSDGSSLLNEIQVTTDGSIGNVVSFDNIEFLQGLDCSAAMTETLDSFDECALIEEQLTESDGFYFTSLPFDFFRSVWYDGLLANYIEHYTLSGNDRLIPNEALIAGTEVIAQYVVGTE